MQHKNRTPRPQIRWAALQGRYGALVKHVARQQLSIGQWRAHYRGVGKQGSAQWSRTQPAQVMPFATQAFAGQDAVREHDRLPVASQAYFSQQGALMLTQTQQSCLICLRLTPALLNVCDGKHPATIPQPLRQRPRIHQPMSIGTTCRRSGKPHCAGREMQVSCFHVAIMP